MYLTEPEGKGKKEKIDSRFRGNDREVWEWQNKKGTIHCAPTGSNKNVENTKYKKCRDILHTLSKN